MRLKRYEGKIESLHCNLGGTDRSIQFDRNVMRETDRLQSHLGETEIPIGKTNLPRVCGSGCDVQTWWRRIGRIGVTNFGFGFRSFVDVGK